MNHPSPKENVLFLGFGDIAKRVVEHAEHDQYDFTGMRRREEDYPGVKLVCGDVRIDGVLSSLIKDTCPDVVIITMTPGDFTDEAYQQAYVQTCQNLVNACQQAHHLPRLTLFVSSSSVYGQQTGEVVDEFSPTEPKSFSGKRLLEAENTLLHSALNTCIVRFSGIYGPGRYRLIEQVKQGKGSPSTPPLYSNRIHADDCARVLLHLIEQSKFQTLESTYLTSDCLPVPLHEVKLWIAKQLQLAPEYLSEQAAPGRMLRSSKRCCNQRLLDTGFQFLYPTYQEGYQSVIREMNKI